MFDDKVMERPVDRRSFLRGSAIFAAALGLSVATTAFAQDPPQPKPEEKKPDEKKPEEKKPEEGEEKKPEKDPFAEEEKLVGDKGNETKVDKDGREYRTCPQCAANMYKQGRTWTCENCGYSYVE